MTIKNNPGSSCHNKKLAIISTNEILINNINEIISSPDDIIKEPDIDSFFKNSAVNFKNTGFIICDIDSFKCDSAAGDSGDFLKKFADGFSKVEKNGKGSHPPIIFTFSKFKSHIFENSIINAEYEKFLGFFKIDEISRNNDRLFSLIRNYLYPINFNEGYIEIGKIFINDFKEIDDLKNFYKTNKSASLFIGKNREEMLRLRADIIQNKDEIKKMVTTVIASEINNDTYKFMEHIQYLSDPKKSNKLKEHISTYFKKKQNDWNGYSILILGDTGVGKSLVVNWIVNFLNEMFKNDKIGYKIKEKSLNCSNLNPNTFESEFFGSLQGAATGIKDSPGMVLGSAGNILFLDEIGGLDMRCQAKLLTYLQDFEFRPFGYQGTPLFIPNIIVAATNENINDEKLFRKDLYHRFKTIIKILPISERHEVIDILIDYVFQNPFINPVIKSGENSLQHFIKYIDTEAYESLKKHNYPGNFRELEAVIKEACARAIYENSSVIKLKHLSLLSK